MNKTLKYLNIVVFPFCLLLMLSVLNSFTLFSIEEQKLSLVKLPLYFVRNDGQLERSVKFYEIGVEQEVYFTQDGVYFLLRDKKGKGRESVEIIKLSILNANKKFEIFGEDEQKGKVNYFIGNSHKKWKNDLPTFGKVRYKEVYSNVDIIFYGNKGNLEYDILIRPGADLSKIYFELQGIKEIRLTEDGGLIATLPSGKSIFQKKPCFYQEIDGIRVDIEGSYIIKREREKQYFGFNVRSYNCSYPLIIDPTLIYSTYLGGSNYDAGYGICVDSSGNVYIIGQTFSSNFPVKSPIKGVKGEDYDIFVTKINPEGKSLLYSTFLGGSSNDYGYAMAVDSSGNAYLTGYTESTDFPTQNPLQKNNAGGRDVFVARINSEGNSLFYSTYLGGGNNDYGYSISVDKSGNTYLAGATYSNNFPTKNPIYGYSGLYDIFITKINSEGNSFVYSTYFGGSNNDYGYGITVDLSGNVYLTGATYSSNFPTKNSIKDKGGLWDAFFLKISPEGNEVITSTCLGGSDSDYGAGIAVDSKENVYLTGFSSSPDFPTQNPIQESNKGNHDIFVTKISSENAIVYSTFLGGGSSDYSRGIAVDSIGNVYITGETYSSDFPTQNPIQGSNSGYWDAFVVKINSEGSKIVYSTYLGGSNNDYGRGITVDSLGNAYLTGYTSSSNFPTALPLFAYSNGYDAFIAKIEEGLIKYNLTVTKEGTGTGIVTSEDGGIVCGSDCSEVYNAGTVVTLTAIPDTDSTFTGWSGNCEGTEQKIQLKMDSDKKCVATFLKSSLPDLCGEWINAKIIRRVSGIKVFEAILRVKNEGTAESSSEFKISFYLSKNGTSLDTLLKTSTISSQINVNEYKDLIFSYYFPSYVSLSGKYIIAVIDLDNAVKERDKTNNKVSYGPVE